MPLKKSCKVSLFVFLQASLLVVLAACGASGKMGPTPTPLPPLVAYESSIYTVELGSITSEETILGNVVPTLQDDLFFRDSGYVDRVMVKEGDAVKKGDLLAELQVADLNNQLEQARIDLESAQSTLDRDETQRKYAIEKADHDVKLADLKVQMAQLDVDNAVLLVDKARTTINLQIAQENLALAKVAQEQASVEVNPYEKQAVERSTLAVQRLEALIDARRIVAPYDCVIITGKLRAGQSVDAFSPVYTVGDPSKLVIRVVRDNNIYSQLRLDSDVGVYPPSGGETTIKAQYLPNFMPLSSVQSESSSSTAEYMYFSLPDELVNQVPVGRQVKLVVVLGHKDNVLLLAPAAIRNYRGINYVIVLDGDKRRRVDLYSIGLKTPERWEVVGELKEGDKVLGP